MGKKPIRVLMVEDHADTLRMLRRLLRRHGYEVLACESVEEGLLVGATAEFDVLVTDLDLPDGWGCSLVERLKEGGREFKAILLTGHTLEAPLSEREAAAFCAYFTKPVDFDALLEAIERCADVSVPSR